MTLRLDVALSEPQKAELASIPTDCWFTPVAWRNATSPAHPDPKLAENNEMKQALVNDWISDSVKNMRVLDLFSANGGFSAISALAGAKEVTGVEFSEERVRCAEFVASTLEAPCPISFRVGDVYRLTEYFSEPFDVVLCLGGLYHVADPAHVLRQIGAVTRKRLILQTSQVLPTNDNRAFFRVRRQDRRREGKTSIQGGYGTWHYSPECLRELLLHGGFRILDERRPPRMKRRRFPWYLALCEPLTA